MDEIIKSMLCYQAKLVISTSTSFTSAMLDMAFVTGIDAQRLSDMLHQCDKADFEERARQFADLVAGAQVDSEPVGILKGVAR